MKHSRVSRSVMLSLDITYSGVERSITVCSWCEKCFTSRFSKTRRRHSNRSQKRQAAAADLLKPLSPHVVVCGDSYSVIACLDTLSEFHCKSRRINHTRSVDKGKYFFESIAVLGETQIKNWLAIDLIFQKHFSPALLVEFYRRIADDYKIDHPQRVGEHSYSGEKRLGRGRGVIEVYSAWIEVFSN